MVVLGDFNAKSSNYNKNITSNEGRKIEAVTSQNGLHQEINEPTHILNNSFSFQLASDVHMKPRRHIDVHWTSHGRLIPTGCIDLIFNSQSNLLIESGVHPSLYPNCHHQIIFAKFNLDIVYPPPYE